MEKPVRKSLSALSACILLWGGKIVLASQAYVPPPPPKLPKLLSKKAVDLGRDLFEQNVRKDGVIEVHNYLGAPACASCHETKTPLSPSALAKKFGELRSKIQTEIMEKMNGPELSRDDPAMEALVQYLIYRYDLSDYKLSK